MEIVDLGSEIISNFSRLNKKDQDLVVNLLKGVTDSKLFEEINTSEKREEIFSLAKSISEQEKPYEIIKKLIISYEDETKNSRNLSFSDFFYKVRSDLQSQIKKVLLEVEGENNKYLLAKSIMFSLTSDEDYYSDDVLDNAKLMTLIKEIKDLGYARLLNDSVFEKNYKNIAKLELETKNTLDKLFDENKIDFNQKLSLNKFIESGKDVLKIYSKEKAIGVPFNDKYIGEFSREAFVCKIISDKRMMKIMDSELSSWDFDF